jgi:hypothetical protein
VDGGGSGKKCDKGLGRCDHVIVICESIASLVLRPEYAYLLMNLLWLLIIMAVVCPSCHQEFKNNQGLSRHRRTCQNALPTTTGLLHKRKQKLEREEAAKIARKTEQNSAQERDLLDHNQYTY